MTNYLIKGARPYGGDPADILIKDGRIAAIGESLSATGAEVIDAAGLIALPGLVDLHTHLREPGREDAETVETGSRAAALGGFTAVHAMANTDPVADTAGVVEQVWRLGQEAGLVDVVPVGAVTVGPAGRAAGRARRDGRLRRPRPGLLRRRELRQRPGADAPRAGVREGLRRRRRPARRGAAADRRRPDARGRPLGPARPHRLAGRRRGGDHRPRRAARRPRRRPAARLPRLDGGLGGAAALGQVARRPGDRRGHPAPPAAHRRLRRELRPGVQGQPAAAHGRRRRGAPRRAGRRHDRRRRHRPRPARGGGQGERVGAGPARDARAGAGALGRRRDDGRDRAARLARRRRPDVGAPRGHRPAGRARPPARPRRAGQPPAAGRHDPGHRRPGRAGQPQPQQPLRRPGAPRPGGRDVPAGRRRPFSTERRQR